MFWKGLLTVFAVAVIMQIGLYWRGDPVVSLLQAAGYTEVERTGYRYSLTCKRHGDFEPSFTATYRNGTRVAGIVCMGFWSERRGIHLL
jgi:hypothetical protein